jgi:DNA-cytosine methyltransferase
MDFDALEAQELERVAASRAKAKALANSKMKKSATGKADATPASKKPATMPTTSACIKEKLGKSSTSTKQAAVSKEKVRSATGKHDKTQAAKSKEKHDEPHAAAKQAAKSKKEHTTTTSLQSSKMAEKTSPPQSTKLKAKQPRTPESSAVEGVERKKRCAVKKNGVEFMLGEPGPRVLDKELKKRLALPHPLPPVTQTDWGCQRPIIIGSDFAGINSPILALMILGIPHTEAFMSDKDPKCQRMLLHHFPRAANYYSHVEMRDNATTPYVDVYLTTAPCQPFSQAGKRLGVEDARGTLFFYSLDFVEKKHSKLVLMENVQDLFLKFHDFYLQIVHLMTALGYDCPVADNPVVNTKWHGVPQNRGRMVLVFTLTSNARCQYEPPAPLNYVVKLKELLHHMPGIDPAVGSLPSHITGKRARVQEGFAKAVAKGFHPSVDCVVVDVAASDKFANISINMMPCLTATRGQSKGFWVSSLGRRITTTDMMKIHAIPTGFYRPEECDVSDAAFGHQLGNTISINIMMRILPRALYAARLVHHLPKRDYWEKALDKLFANHMADRC